ncbi:ly6/PLAUR domain-containing protein 3-like [Synchiropus picturatus]
MYLLLMMVGAGLLSPALSLTCYQCPLGPSGSCSPSTQRCPSPEQRCAAHRTISYYGGVNTSDLHEKGCALPEHCGEMSLNYGSGRKVVNIQCCGTDLCNHQPAPNPSSNTPNGKKCYWCNGTSCELTVECLGIEDHCVTSTSPSGGLTLKGCASRQACDPVPSPPQANSSSKQAAMECCQGDLCNGDVSTTSPSDRASADSTA